MFRSFDQSRLVERSAAETLRARYARQLGSASARKACPDRHAAGSSGCGRGRGMSQPWRSAVDVAASMDRRRNTGKSHLVGAISATELNVLIHQDVPYYIYDKTARKSFPFFEKTKVIPPTVLCLFIRCT